MMERIRHYFKSHFASAFVLSFLIFAGILIWLLLFFLKTEYYEYLSKTSKDTEVAVCRALASSLDATFEDDVEQGAQLAAETGLGKRLLAAVNGENGADTALYNYLAKKDYTIQTVAIALVGEEGLIQQYDLYRTPARSLWSESNMQYLIDMYEELISSSEIRNVTGDYFPRVKVFSEPYIHPLRGGKQVFHIAYPFLGDGSGITNYKYVLVVTYDLNEIRDSLDEIDLPEINLAEGYVTDSENYVIAKSDLLTQKEQLDIAHPETGISYMSRDLSYFGWKLVFRLDESVLKKHVDVIYRRGFAIYLLIIGLFIMACLVEFRFFLLRPVQRIREAIQSVREGRRDSIAINGSNELWQLAGEYNSMVDELELQQQKVEEQHQQAMEYQSKSYEAEREALESQINAHFICNTLGAISYDASDAGDTKTAILLKKLSNILRYTFDRKTQEVFLFQEISWIEQYLYLQKERFENVFDYQIDYDENYGDWPCCKLMFQPFVENSILHGFEGRKEGGLLTITAREQGGRLHIAIADNGYGMPEETADVIQRILSEKGDISKIKRGKVGVGILNVVVRMKMFYGADFDAEMTTSRQLGTTFHFCVPLPIPNETGGNIGEEEDTEKIEERARWL